ncbi:MAG: hypothetical protein R3B60_02840 [Candidatus Paceibacterota bacterium]
MALQNQSKFTPKNTDFDLNFDWYWTNNHEQTFTFDWNWFVDWLTPEAPSVPLPPYIGKVIAPAKNSSYYTILKTKQYFPDVGIMHEISKCESNRRHRSSDGKLLPDSFGGSSRGAFQLLLRVHHSDMRKMRLSPFKDDDHFIYLRYLYDTKGTQPWYMSKHCWENKQHNA